MQKHWIEQHQLGWNAWKAQKSAQEMYDRIFTMKFLPPGRGTTYKLKSIALCLLSHVSVNLPVLIGFVTLVLVLCPPRIVGYGIGDYRRERALCSTE